MTIHVCRDFLVLRPQSSQQPGLRAEVDAHFDGIDPVEIYAAAIDTSNYVARIAPVIQGLIPDVGHLLDIGAGGGQLGAGLHPRGWTAIEPNPNMRARLARFLSPPEMVPHKWQDAQLAHGAFDTVLAATMGSLMDEPGRFLQRCRAWSRRNVVWVVPAHNGPRGLVLAGCLPREWHNEDETPGLDFTLRGLTPELLPHRQIFVDWIFTAVVADIAATAEFLAGRLHWPADDGRRAKLRAHLISKTTPVATGYRLDIPRKSAILTWGCSCVGNQSVPPG